MKNKSILSIGVLTLLVSMMDILMFPSILFVNFAVADIKPIYITGMVNQLIIVVLITLWIRYLYPAWKFGLRKTNVLIGIKQNGSIGILAALIFTVAFYIGLKPFDYTPSIWKIIIEGFIYYIGVSIVEELYIRGLLLNLLERIFQKKSNATTLAIVLSSVIFGFGHFFGVVGSPLIVIISKISWTIGLGLYLGVIYKKTNNLFVPIIMHAIIDFCAVPYCFSTFTGYPEISLWIILPTSILLLGGWSVWALRKDFQNPISEQPG